MSPRPAPSAPSGPTSEGRELDGLAALEAALAEEHALHLPGARARHRAHVERAVARLSSRLDDAATPEEVAALRLALLRAHRLRARDARHGVGQLSRSAQRAPTERDCEDGWRAVAGIAANARASADAAAQLAAALEDRAAERWARDAAQAAAEAERVLAERNHAYTFHTDPAFSFGEGWYVAAAGVLAGVTIQLEPGPRGAAAERFLHDAGLGAQLVPYRSRPRANKALPALVAAAFRRDPTGAAEALRAAFLGHAPPDPAVEAFADAALAGRAAGPKVLVWVRTGAHQPERNSRREELDALASIARERGLTPVVVGDAMPGGALPDGALDLTRFWARPLFQGVGMRRAQLQLFERLRAAHRVVGQVGVTTAGMDGPALMGLPTVYLTDAPNPRLGLWVGAVPGYEEVVRGADTMGRVAARFAEWAGERGASAAGASESDRAT